jgi:formate-nitrite transporter family protein
MKKVTKSRQAESEKSAEADRVEEKSTPPTPVIYEIVRRLGVEEMKRPAVSLWWSGVAAGLSICFSVLAESALRMHLPDSAWRPLLVALGFPVGFLMVVLGRQQLFTENTITVVLPVMAEPKLENFTAAARMWAIVLAANLAGTLCMALAFNFTPMVGAELRESMLAISREGMQHGWLEMGCLAILPGFLMAALVWLLPGAGESQFAVIALITYVIGVAGFAHVISGSVEAFLLATHGELGVGPMLGQFMLPALAGNIIGGTLLFAMLSHAQVMQEM